MSTPSDASGPDDEATTSHPESERPQAPATHAQVPWPTTPPEAEPREESRFTGDETSILDLSALDPAARAAIEDARAQRGSAAGQPRRPAAEQGPRHGAPAPAGPEYHQPAGPQHQPGPPQQWPAGPPQQPPAGPPEQHLGPPPQHLGPQHPGNPQRPQFSWPRQQPDRPDFTGGHRGPDGGGDNEDRTTELRPGAGPGFRPPPSSGQGFDNFFSDSSTPDDDGPDPWGSPSEPAPSSRQESFLRAAARPDGFGARASGGAAEKVTSKRRRPAATGWRRVVSKMTFGAITPGPSAKQEEHEELIRLIKSPLGDTYVVAFVNAKGGVGKTTVTVGAGSAIARERGDRVIAVDVDTDLGNLSSRFHVKGDPTANIEALASLKDPSAYPTVQRFMVQNESDLEMLASQNDPRVSYTLNSQDFETTMRILRLHYNVVLLDCGTAITSPLFSTIAKQLDALVVVASQDPPGLNGAWATLTWLQSHGFSALLPRTVVTVNAPSKGKALVDVDESEDLFRELVPDVKVIRVPYDVHLAEGGDIEFAELKSRTRKSLTALAGAIAEHYPVRGQRRSSESGGF